MTNYYMRVSGSDAANGLTPATAWASLNHALDNPLSPGDTLYIGPGTYRHIDNARAGLTGSSGNPIIFYGDYLGEYTGDPYGPVCISGQNVDGGMPPNDFTIQWTGNTKLLEFHNIVFLGGNTTTAQPMMQLGLSVGAFNMDGIVFEDCVFMDKGSDEVRGGWSLKIDYGDGAQPDGTGLRIRRCLFSGMLELQCDNNVTANHNVDALIESCIFTKYAPITIDGQSGTFNFEGIVIRNCSSLNNYAGNMLVGFNYPKNVSNLSHKNQNPVQNDSV